MPIEVRAIIRHLDQHDFGRIAYEAMGHVFEIHNEFGRFFLLEHTSLKVIQWIKVVKDEVSFQTIRK